jgi:hypothetical protein
MSVLKIDDLTHTSINKRHGVRQRSSYSEGGILVEKRFELFVCLTIGYRDEQFICGWL